MQKVSIDEGGLIKKLRVPKAQLAAPQHLVASTASAGILSLVHSINFSRSEFCSRAIVTQRESRLFPLFCHKLMMATPTFGFSVCDFITAIILIKKVSVALKDSGGCCGRLPISSKGVTAT